MRKITMRVKTNKKMFNYTKHCTKIFWRKRAPYRYRADGHSGAFLKSQSAPGIATAIYAHTVYTHTHKHSRHRLQWFAPRYWWRALLVLPPRDLRRRKQKTNRIQRKDIGIDDYRFINFLTRVRYKMCMYVYIYIQYENDI